MITLFRNGIKNHEHTLVRDIVSFDETSLVDKLRVL